MCFKRPDSFTLWYSQSSFDSHLVILKMDLQSWFVYKNLLFPADYLRETGGKSFFFPHVQPALIIPPEECSESLLFLNRKMSSTINALEERDAIQRDFDRLERWAMVKMNKAKCNVLLSGQGNHQYP